MRSPFGSKARRSSGGESDGVAPDIHLEGFDSLELIGSGGFSRVYKARQSGFERDVALKVLSVGLDSPTKQRAFERECRAMGVLSQHPNIVTVFNAAFTDDRRPCIVMQYYAGGTLGDRVKGDGPLSVEAGLSLGIQMAGALETAHRNGVIHRDIKPTNLFVSDYGQPALGDFGISSFDDDRTITGGGGGLTVHYAPPELIEGDSATPMSDVYSLAATLFTLWVGRRPFPRPTGQSVGELARRILIEAAPRLEVDGAPPALADLVRRAMAKDPTDRPPTAAAFGRELQAIQASLGLSATAMSLPGETGAGSEPIIREPAATPKTETPKTEPTSGESSVATTTTARARPRSNESPEADLGEENIAQPKVVVSRRTRGYALAAVAAITIGGGAFALARSSTDTASPASVTSTIDLDDETFFSTPPVPASISIDETDDPLVVEVTWAIPEEDADGFAFQVERLDSGEVIDVETSPAPLMLERANDSVCVVVRSVGEGGRLSPDSEIVCR